MPISWPFESRRSGFCLSPRALYTFLLAARYLPPLKDFFAGLVETKVKGRLTTVAGLRSPWAKSGSPSLQLKEHSLSGSARLTPA